MVANANGDRVAAAAERRQAIETELKDELDRLGDTNKWVWTLFVVGFVPGIMSGFHLSSYVFLAKLPDVQWCDIGGLRNSTWTADQTSQLSASFQTNKNCTIADYDYASLSRLDYERASEATRKLWSSAANATSSDAAADRSTNAMTSMSCLATPNATMQFKMDGNSIVSEWGLVCERSVLRTATQTGVSMGKALGAIATGILADRYGRRTMYASGAITYLVSSVLLMFTPWYAVFLLGRFLLGISNSMMFYPTGVMVAENVDAKHRFWTGMAMHIAYSVGMLYLAAAAYFIETWRQLQCALTVPAICLLINLRFYKESPRWLISKGRLREAHKAIFGGSDKDTERKLEGSETPTATATGEDEPPAKKRGMFRVVGGLYMHPKYRSIILICHYIYLTSSFSYYVSIINADNLAANRVVYVIATAFVDITSYMLNIVLLRKVGRRWNLSISFGVAGLAYLAMLAVAPDRSDWRLALAMIARLCICSAYGLISLYAAELFPTEVRGSAIGVCSTLAHCGSMSAPFVVDFLGRIAWYIPTTICGVALFVAAMLVFLSPETSKSKLEDFVDEAPPVEDRSMAQTNGHLNHAVSESDSSINKSSA